MKRFAPFLATIQRLLKRCAFLSKKKRTLLCIGRTFTGARTDVLHNCPKHVVGQLGIGSGLCKS
jgi:hypothetical protein